MENSYYNIEEQNEIANQEVFQAIEMEEAHRTARVVVYSAIIGIIVVIVLAIVFWFGIQN